MKAELQEAYDAATAGAPKDVDRALQGLDDDEIRSFSENLGYLNSVVAIERRRRKALHRAEARR